MRRRRSYLRAFGNGLTLAALPVVAFLVADHLLTPPSDGSSPGAARRMSFFDRGLAQIMPAERPHQVATAPEETGPQKSVAPAALKSLIKSAVGDGASGGRSSLVASIQEELRRVGCYGGDADGRWTDATKAAMTAFNANVNVRLATDRPDYIHLTLLQGHSSKACAGRSIEARAVSPGLHDGAPKSTVTSVEVRPSSPVGPAPRSPAATAIVRVAPSQAAGGPLLVGRTSDGEVLKPGIAAAPDEPVPSRGGSISSAPIPGRMAIGALDGPQPNAEEAAPEAVVADDLKPKPAVLPQAARPRPVTESRPAWGPKRAFSDLSSNSP